jgi:hypothetical protein
MTNFDHERLLLIASVLVLVLGLLVSPWWLLQKWQGCQKIYDNRPAQIMCLLSR